jgi:hypothetical protein
MDRVRYKPVHRLIKAGIRDRLKIVKVGGGKSRAFEIRMTDLDELKQDLGVAELEVLASKKQSGCKVAASIKLGPSDGGKTLSLQSLYTESETSLLPPFRKVKSVTLSGVDLTDSQLVKRQYLAK